MSCPQYVNMVRVHTISYCMAASIATRQQHNRSKYEVRILLLLSNLVAATLSTLTARRNSYQTQAGNWKQAH